ncbi:MAG: PAAR domain-containing protein [Chitinophagaceae bacterium]|nr:PAAR domain-containing protein [Chitinophagaceae bacterium]
MPLAARINDNHICPMTNPNGSPHVGGTLLPPGAPTVFIGGQPAAVVGGMCTCSGPPDSIIKGAATVLIGGQQAARMGDSTAHGGSIVSGCATVIIGG